MDDLHHRLLLALADKYRVMRRMRDEAQLCEMAAARRDMAALAARFPGALRELDELPPALLETRLHAIEVAIEQAEPQRWMLLQAGYHGFMRAALRIRRLIRAYDGPLSLLELAGACYVPAEDEPPLARFGQAELGVIAKPPGGRLNPWVFAQVARDHDTSPEAVRSALFLR